MSELARSIDPLHCLLATLDADPRGAAERYETLRTRLVGRFRARGLLAPEDLADETFDRVARRLSEGEHLRDVERYLLGTARLVALEAGRRAARCERLDDEVAGPSPAARDTALDQLAVCLAELPEPARQLLLRYEDGQRGERIAQRRALAHELGIPINALRLRIRRLREKLLTRLSSCVSISQGLP
jgi:DNA-directed RNA polymerase specialized sigma24 family protein